jgi:hypothetical protein
MSWSPGAFGYHPMTTAEFYMRLTILTRGPDDFGVVLNLEEQHRTKQWIYKVTVSDEDLARLADNRVDKENLVEFAINFLLERESPAKIMTSFTIMTIADFFPEFIDTARQWVDDNAA